MSNNKRELKLPYPFSLEEALKKSPKLKVSDLNILREWSEKQPHLPKATELLLVMFLQSSDYNVEAAKTTMENYYTIRSHVPEVFDNRDPFSKELRHAFNVSGMFPLPGFTVNGYKAIFCDILEPDPSLFMFAAMCKFFFMCTDLLAMNTGICPGYVFVGNASRVAFGHASRINLLLMKKLFFYIQEAIPTRVKEIHIVNTIPALDIILNIIKPFMKKELVNMITLHPTMDSLAKFVPLESIPYDVDGKSTMTVAECQEVQIKELENNRWWFMEEENCQRVDESKRIGKSKIVNELFGVEGTFKKLGID